MSDSEPEGDISLAFVDVITNGLGAMLVLFFVVVLLQASLEFSPSADQAQHAKRERADPFVLLVHAPHPVFDADATAPVWKAEGFPADRLEAIRGVNWDWGPSHAVFLAGDPPPARAELKLRVTAAPVGASVEMHHGDRSERRVCPAPDADGWVTVWPLPAEAAP